MSDQNNKVTEEPVYTNEEITAMDESASAPDRVCLICGEEFFSGDAPDEYVCEDCKFEESGVVLFRHHKSKKEKSKFGMVSDRKSDYSQKIDYRPLRSERSEHGEDTRSC